MIAIVDVAGTITEGTTLTDSGSITFSDLDLTDTPTASEVTQSVTTALTLTAAQQTAIEDAFTISPDAGNTNNGTINWDYTITEAELDFLAAGETVTVVYTITVNDANGGTDTQDVTLSIIGANDAPVIAIVDVAGSITEGTTLTDSGSITFSDLDLTDTPTASEVTQSVTTALTLTAAQQTAIEEAFTLSAEAGNSNNGTINWDYTITEAELDFLAAGETVAVVYTITVNDANGGTDTEDVTISITGANDAATISSVDQALTETDAPLTTSGTLTSADVDNPDDTFTPSSTVGTIGTFSIDAAGAWSFTANSAFDNLNVGDNVNETFNVTSIDGTTSTVKLTINGTNDAATVSSVDQALSETDAPLTTGGTLTSADVDNPDNTFTPVTTVGTTGTFAIDAAGAWTFTANSAFDNLNVGDNVNETFNVTSVDGTTSTVKITINGTNDAATVSSVDQALYETDAPLTTGGTLTSADVDNPDNTFTPVTTVGTTGTFAIDAAGAWTFTANSAFDNLNVGDNVNETFNVTSVDGTTSTVKLTINGTNDAATVSSVDQALSETDAPLTTGGTLTSSDVDNTFTPTTINGTTGAFNIDAAGAWTFTANSAFDSLNSGDNVNETFNVTSVDGTASTVKITINGTNDAATVSSVDQALNETDAPLTTGGTLTSSDVYNADNTFTPTTINGTTGAFNIDAAGAWTFTANSAFDSLNSGDNVNETFNVTSVDGTASTVKITINGTNDAATVSSVDQALNETDAPLTTGGTLTSADVDNLDNTFTPVTTVGTTGTFAIDAAGVWTFTANSAFDSLNAGDNVNETFNVTSIDGTASTVKITINGTNDAATVSSVDQALSETDAPLTTGGTLTSADVDNPDNTFTPVTTVGTTGTFAIDAAGAWTFTANSAFDSLNAGDNVNENFNVTSVDGTTSTVKITINGTNDAATVSSVDQALSETDAPLTTGGTLTSADVDNLDNTFTPVTTVGTTGTFAIDAAGAWTFIANSAFDNLNAAIMSTKPLMSPVLMGPPVPSKSRSTGPTMPRPSAVSIKPYPKPMRPSQPAEH